jgi:glucosyl-3-phosphoglycerate synthase
VQVLAAAERRRGAHGGGGAPAGQTVDLTQYVRGATGFEPQVSGVGIGERPAAASVGMPSAGAG